MNAKDYDHINTQIQLIHRDLLTARDKLARNMGTQFEPNKSEMKAIKSKLSTIRKKANELSHM